MQMAGNAGATDEQTGVEVGQPHLSGTRKIVAPFFSYTKIENKIKGGEE